MKKRKLLKALFLKSKTHKYIKRLPKSNGKGYIYFYDIKQLKEYKDSQKQPEEKKKGFLSGIMSFFGLKTKEETIEKIKTEYDKNKSKLENISINTFSDYLNEYLSNKDKWDKRLKNKSTPKISENDNSTHVENPEKEKTVNSEKKKSQPKETYKLSIMRKIAEIANGFNENNNSNKNESESNNQEKSFDMMTLNSAKKYINFMNDMKMKNFDEQYKRAVEEGQDAKAMYGDRQDYLEYNTKLTKQAIKNLISDIDGQNYKDLESRLHTHNNFSRSIFEEYTGIALGKTDSSMKEAVKKFVGEEKLKYHYDEEKRIKDEEDKKEKERIEKENFDKYGYMTFLENNPLKRGKILNALKTKYRYPDGIKHLYEGLEYYFDNDLKGRNVAFEISTFEGRRGGKKKKGVVTYNKNGKENNRVVELFEKEYLEYLVNGGVPYSDRHNEKYKDKKVDKKTTTFKKEVIKQNDEETKDNSTKKESENKYFNFTHVGFRYFGKPSLKALDKNLSGADNVFDMMKREYFNHVKDWLERYKNYSQNAKERYKKIYEESKEIERLYFKYKDKYEKHDTKKNNSENESNENSNKIYSQAEVKSLPEGFVHKTNDFKSTVKGFGHAAKGVLMDGAIANKFLNLKELREKGYFTDGQMLISDPEVSKKLFSQADKKLHTSDEDIKSAEESNKIVPQVENMFKDNENKISEKPAEVTGVIKHSNYNLATLKYEHKLNKETEYIGVDTNKLALLDKHFTNITYHPVGDMSPIIVKSNGKIVGMFMPIVKSMIPDELKKSNYNSGNLFKGKPAQIGEVRTFKNGKFRKDASGDWIPVSDKNNGDNSNNNKKKDKNKKKEDKSFLNNKAKKEAFKNAIKSLVDTLSGIYQGTGGANEATGSVKQSGGDIEKVGEERKENKKMKIQNKLNNQKNKEKRSRPNP